MKIKKITRQSLILSVIFFLLASQTCKHGKNGENNNNTLVNNSSGATTTIGSSGGSVEVTNQADSLSGTKVEIPAGALSSDTTITIEEDSDSSMFSGSIVVKLGPAGTTFNAPVKVTIPYSDAFVDSNDISDESKLLVFIKNKSTGEFELTKKVSQDTTNNLITIETEHFSIFTAIPELFFKAFNQTLGFLDPEKYYNYTLPSDIMYQDEFLLSKAILLKTNKVSRSIRLGKGTYTTLKDDGKKTLILVHGLFSDPLTFIFKDESENADDIFIKLRDSSLYDNIVFFQYPSGLSITENGKKLADEICGYNIENADIIAHSMGGLVSRWAIEHGGNGDCTTSTVQSSIKNLVTLGTPHSGMGVGFGQEDTWLDWAQAIGDAFMSGSIITGGKILRLSSGIIDTGQKSEFIKSLNDTYSNPEGVRYFLIAGTKGISWFDRNNFDDGLIALDSAFPTIGSFQLSVTEGEKGWICEGTGCTHSGLHEEAVPLGVLDQIKLWLLTSISPAGGTYTSSPNITISTAATGATIHYTTDGSTPTCTTGTVYTNAITIAAATTVKAIACKTGLTESSVVSAIYTISSSSQTATPTFSPSGGTYTSAQGVTINTTTTGASIYYTTDGSTPICSSGTAYSSAINVTSSTTIKAIACKSGLTDSSVASAIYTIETLSQVSTPTFSPSGGTFSSAQSVTVSTATTGASIYYTIDSSTPTCSTGTAYSGAINVAVTTTIKAIACKSGMTDSDLASAIYTISQITTQKVADTGQTTSYTTTFGEDHDYVNIPNARSFTGPTQHIIYITDYTTTDNVTGLIWTSCSIGQSGATCTGSATTHTWSDAQIQCAGLNSVNGSAGYAGRTGWRLPIIEELQTLLNYGTYNPAIDTTYFPNTVSDKYWSATTSANSTTYAWNVNFNDGYANGYNKTYSSYVRCVCTGP